MHAVRAACTARSQLTVWHGGVRMRRPFIVEATADWPAPRLSVRIRLLPPAPVRDHSRRFMAVRRHSQGSVTALAADPMNRRARSRPARATQFFALLLRQASPDAETLVVFDGPVQAFLPDGAVLAHFFGILCRTPAIWEECIGIGLRTPGLKLPRQVPHLFDKPAQQRLRPVLIRGARDMAVAGHPYRFATRTVMTTIGQTTAGCRRVSFRLNPRFRASDFTVSATTHAVSLEHRCLSRTITLFVRDIVKLCVNQRLATHVLPPRGTLPRERYPLTHPQADRLCNRGSERRKRRRR